MKLMKQREINDNTSIFVGCDTAQQQIITHTMPK